MEVAAENATVLPRLGRPRQKLKKHASHTAVRSVNGAGPTQIESNKSTCADRRFPLCVDVVEKSVSRDPTVPGKSEHLRGLNL